MPPIDNVKVPDSEKVSRVDAAVLLGISPGRVATLVREGALTEPLTIGALKAYAASKTIRPSRGPRPEGKQYLVRLTPEQYKSLKDSGVEIEDPRAKAKEREAAQLAAAAKRLTAMTGKV